MTQLTARGVPGFKSSWHLCVVFSSRHFTFTVRGEVGGGEPYDGLASNPGEDLGFLFENLFISITQDCITIIHHNPGEDNYK